MDFPAAPAHDARVPIRAIKVLDAAPLARRNVVVLELDTPNPVTGIFVGMPIELVFRDESRVRVELKGLGFASSTPDHAHVIVTAPSIEHDLTQTDRIEVETRA
ncbi:MAG: hypothetical protein NVSMB47_14260 [Polyangiales bacterium]